MVTELDNLITVREAAKECGRAEETVRRWVWSGKLKARKLGNQLYINKSDLAASFCKSRRTQERNRIDSLEKAWKVQDRIHKRLRRNIDILEALERSRESHP